MLLEVAATPETIRHLETALVAVRIAEAQASGAFAVFCSERGLPPTTQLVQVVGSRVQVSMPDPEPVASVDEDGG